jgi:hypothetical protein
MAVSATTNVHTRVEVGVWARSTTWVANELVRVLQEVVHLRGLTMDYMHQHNETLTSGFRTWITSRWLKGSILEVWDANSDQLVERYDLGLSYQPKGQGGDERFETQIEKVAGALAQLQKLNGSHRYRVIADLEPGAPSLPGWEPTSLRDTSHLRKQDLGNVIDTARIGVAMGYWV